MDSGRGEVFLLLFDVVFSRDGIIYHYKVVTNLVFLNYIPHVLKFTPLYCINSFGKTVGNGMAIVVACLKTKNKTGKSYRATSVLPEI
jgi:hypothetical protein